VRIGRGFTGREHSRGGSPYSPSTGLRFFADAISGAGITTLSRVRHRDPASAHGTAFREGIAAKRRAVGVFQRERFFCETGDRGGGCSVPLPVSPSPRGDIPSMHCRGRASPRLDVNTLPKSCLVPWHGHRANRQSTARPLPGGGRRRGTRREVGVFQRKPFNGRRMRQGRGMFHPRHRRAPHPRGRYPIDALPGIWQSLRGLT